MQRPSTPTGLFTGGNPLTGQKGDSISAAFLNDLTMEICNVITGAGIALDQTSQVQFLAAIRALIGGGGSLPTALKATSGETITPTVASDGTITWAVV